MEIEDYCGDSTWAGRYSLSEASAFNGVWNKMYTVGNETLVFRV